MADELDQALADNPAETRIKELSGKVKTVAGERDEALKAKQDAEAKLADAQKAQAFAESFSDSLSKYPNAKDFKDDIKSKVMAGYTVEDATVSVLASKGKLSSAPAEPEMPAGGSAPTNPPSNAEKSLKEMTQAERRAALVDAESRGDLAV